MDERATTAQTATFEFNKIDFMCSSCVLCASVVFLLVWGFQKCSEKWMRAFVYVCLCLWEHCERCRSHMHICSSSSSGGGHGSITNSSSENPNLTLMPCKRFSLYDSFHFIRCLSMAITIPGCIDIKMHSILRGVSRCPKAVYSCVPFFSLSLSLRSCCCCCCHAFILHLFCKIVNWLCTPWLSATRFHRCLIFIISYYCYSVQFSEIVLDGYVPVPVCVYLFECSFVGYKDNNDSSSSSSCNNNNTICLM